MDREAMLNRRATERVGSVLHDKWTLERLLGVGGMASVYAARHRNGKLGAVKLLHLELAMDPEWRERFLREGYVANAIAHPGVVSVLDDDTTEDGSVFLVMELLEGMPTDAAASKRPKNRLDPGEVVRIAAAVLGVLAAAHEKGIVHRDMKPENLFLCSDGQVKVLDFGIARLRERPAGSSATRTGATMGTPAYMPPEQALGHNHQIDERTDIWGLGATMFTLLAGRYVHEADTANKLLLAAMTRHAPKLREVVPEIAPALADIVDKALAFEQADRFQSAREMQDALRALGSAPLIVAPELMRPTLPAVSTARAAALTASAVATDSIPGQPPPERRKPPLLVLGIGAVSMAIGAIAVVLLRGAPAPPAAAPEATAPAGQAASPAPPSVEPQVPAPAAATAPAAGAATATAPAAATATATATATSTAATAATATAAPVTQAAPRGTTTPAKPPTKKKDPLDKW